MNYLLAKTFLKALIENKTEFMFNDEIIAIEGFSNGTKWLTYDSILYIRFAKQIHLTIIKEGEPWTKVNDFS